MSVLLLVRCPRDCQVTSVICEIWFHDSIRVLEYNLMTCGCLTKKFDFCFVGRMHLTVDWWNERCLLAQMMCRSCSFRTLFVLRTIPHDDGMFCHMQFRVSVWRCPIIARISICFFFVHYYRHRDFHFFCCTHTWIVVQSFLCAFAQLFRIIDVVLTLHCVALSIFEFTIWVHISIFPEWWLILRALGRKALPSTVHWMPILQSTSVIGCLPLHLYCSSLWSCEDDHVISHTGISGARSAFMVILWLYCPASHFLLILVVNGRHEESCNIFECFQLAQFRCSC